LEARAIILFVKSFKAVLQSIKSSYSRNILARKEALLDAAVSLGLDGIVTLSRVLKVHPNNISTGLGRRSTFSAPSFVPLLRKKREGLMEYIKDTVRK
jgi:hypothetical protein